MTRLPWIHRKRLEQTEGYLDGLLIVVERSARTLPTECRFHPNFDPNTGEGYEDSCSPCRAVTARYSLLSVCRIVRDSLES